MSSVEYLREFVNERLAVAAEEIFGVFKRTIVEYEEELDRQRRLLENAWKPGINLQRTELPHQHVCKEEEVLADQERNSSLDQEDPEPPQIKEEPEEELCTTEEGEPLELKEEVLADQERNSSLDQEDPEPPQIKEEPEEELCTTEEGEPLELKEETDSFMITPTYEESDNSEDQTQYLNSDETQSVVEEQPLSYISVVSSGGSEANSEHQLLSHNFYVAGSQDQTAGKHGDAGSCSVDAQLKQQNQQHKSNTYTYHVYNPAMSVHRFITQTGEKSFKCDTCERVFKSKFHLQRHQTIHTGEKPYSCKICGKDFRHNSTLKVHIRTHTGEKPYSCKICGKRFSDNSPLKRHMRVHTDEKKTYTCKTCGKRFCQMSDLRAHARIHTGEKPFKCETCGRAFRLSGHLRIHIRAHNGEKPYVCKVCGNRYFRVSHLLNHMAVHTGE